MKGMPAGLIMKLGQWTIQILVVVFDGAKPETAMRLL